MVLFMILCSLYLNSSSGRNKDDFFDDPEHCLYLLSELELQNIHFLIDILRHSRQKPNMVVFQLTIKQLRETVPLVLLQINLLT